MKEDDNDDQMHEAFMAYENKNSAIKALRYFHDKGMEGNFITIKKENENDLYAVRVLWPLEWNTFQIKEFLYAMP